MSCYDCDYEGARRLSYLCPDGSEAVFVPVCMNCHRFVKPDDTVLIGEAGLHPGPNALCSRCGRTRMHFEGFV